MRDILFLDLENTLIDTWTSPSITNHHLKNQIEALHISDIRLFSFAILNEDDRKFFNKNIAPAIKEFFSITFSDIVLIDSITDELALEKSIHFFDVVDRIDFRNTLGKQDFFLRFCRRFNDSNIFLFDDSVEDLVVADPKRNNTITLVRV